MSGRRAATPVEAAASVEVHRDIEVHRILGTERLEGVEVENPRMGGTCTLETPAVFSFIGAVPRTNWLLPQIGTDADLAEVVEAPR